MNPALREIVLVTLRMYFRNRMALAYSYVFPVMFLVAFLVLYGRPLLIEHMGELLTVTILGGACFGLPTSLVSEREHGVWRRYRLSPVPPAQVILGTLLARYLMILTAGVLQVAACMVIGGWTPDHPFQLWLAFSLVTFALLGLGLVIAAMADTVPAVQALGQLIFLPMLILGGVIVKLSAFSSLPWVLHLSAFFPGRYAVEVMQACVLGDGMPATWFSVLAVIVTGAGAGVSGARLFRWDAQQRFTRSARRPWLLATLAAWLLIGVAAEIRREIAPRPMRRALPPAVAVPKGPAPEVPVPPATPPPGALPSSPHPQPSPVVTSTGPATSTSGVTPAPVSATPPAKALPAVQASDAPWRSITFKQEQDLPYEQVALQAPDNGNVAPIADASRDEPDDASKEILASLKEYLGEWPPGQVADPLQRVRNYMLLVGGVDYAQSVFERFLPELVLNHMLEQFPRADLTKMLTWIALHPQEGSAEVLDDNIFVNLSATNLREDEVRFRTYLYSVKFVYWVHGW